MELPKTNIQHTEELIITEWKTCVEMADAISKRRDSMNNIFITLNLAIITATSIIWNLKSMLLLAAGIGLCILWILFIQNYKRLNKIKFEIINTLEKDLPYKPFSTEWKALKKEKKYHDITCLETLIPIGFILVYTTIAAIIFAHK